MTYETEDNNTIIKDNINWQDPLVKYNNDKRIEKGWKIFKNYMLNWNNPKLPSAVNLINMDGTIHSRERNSQAPANSLIIDNDDNTWGGVTTSGTQANNGPFILRFSFPNELVGKTLKSVLFQHDPTENHVISCKFAILNNNTYTSLNVLSGVNIGNSAVCGWNSNLGQ